MRIKGLIERINNILAKTEDPFTKKRYRERLKLLSKELKALESLNSNIKSINLKEQGFYRELTLQEQRLDIVKLGEQMQKEADYLAQDLDLDVAFGLDKVRKETKRKLDKKDIAGLLAIGILLKPKAKKSIKQAMIKNYEYGKTLASREMKVQRPPALPFQSKIFEKEAEEIAEGMEQGLNSQIQSTIRKGIETDASSQSIINTINNQVIKEASKYIANTVGTVNNQAFNRGRTTVFQHNALDIVAYQRSEILDGRTCDMCLSLDERIIEADDPMHHLDIVHTNCRGFWTPILRADPKVKASSLPKAITDRFEKIDGRPITNGFKNLKKPLVGRGTKQEEEVKKRLSQKNK